EQSRTLGGLLARVIAAELPEIATVTRQVQKRDGKVYLDYVQNGHGRLLVAPFSARPLPGAPVSMPLRWSEVTPKLDIRKFTIKTAPARMQRRASRPEPPAVAAAAVRAAAAEAARLAPGLPLVAGGKSFGGRMTSTAQAEEPLPGVRGLVFLGFPLHPPGRAGDQRAEHLAQVQVPMLFLQGTRDDFADLTLLKPLIKRLGQRATLHLVEGGDHSFHVLKRSGRTDADGMGEIACAIA